MSSPYRRPTTPRSPKRGERAVARIGKFRDVGVDDERDTGALPPDRYYLLSDADSFFFDPAGDNDGFETPEAAAEWARDQTVWPDLGRDLDEGVAAVVLGSEWNANQAAQQAAEAAGFPEGWLERLPPVRNFARRCGLPRPLIEKLRGDPCKDKGK